MPNGLFQALRHGRHRNDLHSDKRQRLQNQALTYGGDGNESGSNSRPAKTHLFISIPRPGGRSAPPCKTQVYVDVPDDGEWDDQDTDEGCKGAQPLGRSRFSLVKGFQARQRKLRTAGNRVGGNAQQHHHHHHSRVLSPLPPNATLAPERHESPRTSPLRKLRNFPSTKGLMRSSPRQLKRERAMKAFNGEGHFFAGLAKKRKRTHLNKVTTPPDSDHELNEVHSPTTQHRNDLVIDDSEDTDPAHMSVDSKSHSGTDGSGFETEDDDSFYLYKATQAQLHRLRRNRLIDLATLLFDGASGAEETHVATATKDVLVKMITDARQVNSRTSWKHSDSSRLSSPLSISESSPPASASEHEQSSDHDTSGVDGAGDGQLLKAPRNRTRHRQRRRGFATQQSPIDSQGRSKSLPHLSDLSLSGQSSSPTTKQYASKRRNKEERSKDAVIHMQEEGAIRRTRSRARLADETALERDTQSRHGSTTSTRRRTARARPASPKRVVTFDSIKLRKSMSPDEQDDNEADDCISDASQRQCAPTPIARRTRRLASQPQHSSLRFDESQSDTGNKVNNGDESNNDGANKTVKRKRIKERLRRHQPSRSLVHSNEDNDASDESDEFSSLHDADGHIDEDEELHDFRDAKSLTPRRLRSGRVVSHSTNGNDDDYDEEEDIDDAVAEGEENEDVDVEGAHDMSDEGARSNDGSETSTYEDDGTTIDLDAMTSKGLLRLRRDKLVQLCAERELEVEGTKKDLVESLLQWRDMNGGDDENDETFVADTSQESIVSISTTMSDATVQRKSSPPGPAETLRAIHRPLPSNGPTPLLLRSDHLVRSKSATPTSNASSAAEHDVGEIDLESLNLQDKEIAPEALKRLEQIGSGGFKDVYRGVYKKLPVAIADIRGHLTEMDLKELRILRDLRHENIVRFIGVSVPESTAHVPVMIVMEICTNGDLFDYIRNVTAPEFGKILKIMKDISKGLEYLHTRTPSIIHRDLKSSNVLITARGVAKLNDFGLARIKNSTRSMVKSLVGTVNWQAPELWVPHPRYNEKVDVYSTGMVFWEALQWHQAVKRYPFEGQNDHAIYQDVGQKQLRPSTAGMRRQWGDDILDLVDRLWAQTPSQRPKMSEVVVKLNEMMAQWKAKSKSNQSSQK